MFFLAHFALHDSLRCIYGNRAYIRLAVLTEIQQAINTKLCITMKLIPMPEEDQLAIVKTSYRISKELKKRVEYFSVQSDKTETEIVSEALEEYLQRHAKKS
jgi:microcompartment protein CcmL/EutN